jgi:hypothetical protein
MIKELILYFGNLQIFSNVWEFFLF